MIQLLALLSITATNDSSVLYHKFPTNLVEIQPANYYQVTPYQQLWWKLQARRAMELTGTLATPDGAQAMRQASSCWWKCWIEALTCVKLILVFLKLDFLYLFFWSQLIVNRNHISRCVKGKKMRESFFSHALIWRSWSILARPWKNWETCQAPWRSTKRPWPPNTIFVYNICWFWSLLHQLLGDVFWRC